MQGFENSYEPLSNSDLKRLWKHSHIDKFGFNGFQLVNKKILRAEYQILKNYFHVKYFTFSKNRKVVAHIPFYKSKVESIPSCLGYLICSQKLNENELADFAKFIGINVKEEKKIIGPQNGHVNLGFSVPHFESQVNDIGFMTAPIDPINYNFYSNYLKWSVCNTYFAMNTKVSLELNEKVNTTIANTPGHIKINEISMTQYKSDIKSYCSLINSCMSGHDNFFNLSFEEDWQLLKGAWPMLNSKYFKFMYVRGELAGCCFGIPDYNFILKNGQDIRNSLKIVRHKNNHNRARIIYSCILPKYRGLKIFKYLRASVIAEMIKNGVREVESSYIDEKNINSIKNVESFGGYISHKFLLFSSSID